MSNIRNFQRKCTVQVRIGKLIHLNERIEACIPKRAILSATLLHIFTGDSRGKSTKFRTGVASKSMNKNIADQDLKNKTDDIFSSYKLTQPSVVLVIDGHRFNSRWLVYQTHIVLISLDACLRYYYSLPTYITTI